MTYRPHGFVPSDEIVAREGFKAFAPKGEPIRPGDDREKQMMAEVHRFDATGDPDELADVAAEVADYWPKNRYAAYMQAMYGVDVDDWWDDDPPFLI